MAKQEDIDKLTAEVARLQEALAAEKQAKTEAEEAYFAAAQAGPFVGNTEEQPTGRTVKMSICLNPAARTEKEHKYKEVDVPTYYYTIQLPTGAGVSLSTNGMEYFHGETYEFDPYMLAEMKSRVARCWDHEKSIHGDNENAYRRPMNHVLSGKRPNRLN